MFNPVLRAKSGPYQTEEACLSLVGSRSTTRYQEITVDYLDRNWQPQTITLKDFPAQICQHELDHLDGILFIDKATVLTPKETVPVGIE